MTLVCRLWKEVHKFGLNEVIDRLREIAESQSELQPEKYQEDIETCIKLFEQLVNIADKLEDMEIK